MPASQLDDAAQEVFWVAARKFAVIEAEREHAFLYGVSLRVASNWLRRRKAEPHLGHLDEARERVDQAPSPMPEAASTLAAEIAALDGVRRAMAAGDFERALEGTAAYSRKFPRGQLAADADALAAQALSARGEHAAGSERAARFLERHPEDPHAARMRRLLER